MEFLSLCSNNQNEMFVTVWFGVLDLKTGLLTASNGGHEKPIIKKPDGHFEILHDKHNLVVGFFKEAPYTEYQIQLEKGSKLFVYTDGIPECRDKEGQFGMNRTVETLIKYEDMDPTNICKNMLNDVTSFMGMNDQFDDITMLCMEYIGYEDNAYHLTIPADKEKISSGIEPIVSFLKEMGVNHKVTYKVEMALEEILVNIASYAYAPNKGDIKIDYELTESPRMISITITDEGKEFNPLEKEDPNILLPTEEREVGGLCLFIVKKTMDEVKYQRINNKNVLILKKKI